MLKQIWDWVHSDIGQSTCQWIMAGLGSVIFYQLYLERKDKIASDSAALEVERRENSLELRKGYALLEEESRSEQRWYADKKLEITSLQLLHGAHHPDLLRMRDQVDATHYANLISMFEQGFIDFYEPEDPEYAEYWEAWDGYINQILMEPGFRNELPTLLTEDSNKEFVGHMRNKLEKFLEGQLDYHQQSLFQQPDIGSSFLH